MRLYLKTAKKKANNGSNSVAISLLTFPANTVRRVVGHTYGGVVQAQKKRIFQCVEDALIFVDNRITCPLSLSVDPSDAVSRDGGARPKECS